MAVHPDPDGQAGASEGLPPLEFPFYALHCSKPLDDGLERLPAAPQKARNHPRGYLPDNDLVDAVNVALLLNQPLLLTGEPGTGKTQLANSVAWQLGYRRPIKFETKSTSTARDLFYIYDALGRYHDRGNPSALDYITFSALGQAIILTNKRENVEQYLPPDYKWEVPRRSVVLIDEIDKAPRDFPNDVLNELEGMYFRVPELGNITIERGEGPPPIVIITSNSEKHLPAAFLRRCTYYHIPFPKLDRMQEIVLGRLENSASLDQDFLKDVLGLFFELRNPDNEIQKKPSTAELISWIEALRVMKRDAPNPLRALAQQRALATMSILIKQEDDRQPAEGVMKQWLDESQGEQDDGA